MFQLEETQAIIEATALEIKNQNGSTIRQLLSLIQTIPLVLLCNGDMKRLARRVVLRQSWKQADFEYFFTKNVVGSNMQNSQLYSHRCVHSLTMRNSTKLAVGRSFFMNFWYLTVQKGVQRVEEKKAFRKCKRLYIQSTPE